MKLASSLFLAALAVLSPSALAQKAGVHQDPKKGFSIKIPDKWTVVPVQIDEKWIVAKFLSNRTYETKARDYKDYGEHKPMVQVIEFSDEARKLRVEEEQRGDTTYISKNVPYRDYKDYLKRNLSEGFYIDKEETTTEAGVQCTKFVVRIEKLSSMKRRLLTWVFRGPKGEFAVETEALEDHYEKLEPQMLATLKSFKLTQITQVETTAPTTGPSGSENMWVKDRRKWLELPAADRHARRKKIEEERLTKAQKDLPAGWVAKRTKHYLVLSHADPKYTARLVEVAEAYRIWLDTMFDTVSDEYVMHGVIRVCADRDEARAYLKSSNNYDSFNVDDREVVDFQDKSEGNAGANWGRLFAGMMDQYMYDKDSLIYANLPYWLHWALYRYVEGSKLKSGKLVFEPEQWEEDKIREAQRNSVYTGIRELMGPAAEETEESKQPKLEFWAQDVRWLRFIMGPGSKREELKDFVVRYVKGVVKVADELEKKRFDAASEVASTEEEEERRANERRDFWKKRRTEILTRVNKDLGWTDEAWSSLEKAFHETLKK